MTTETNGQDFETNRPTIARFSLQQAVLMNLLFGVLILAGGLVVSIMPVDVYPDVDLDEATIDTFWPGASAEDVERLITDPIEDEITDIRGISRIISDSKPDASLIRIRFREDLSATALDAAFRQLRAAVERVTDLPDDAEKPLLTRISLGEIFPLLWVVVRDAGGAGEEALHQVILKLKPILRDIPGVARVDDKLIRDREIHLRVNRDSLRKYDMTLDEVAAVLSQYNRNVPSGTLPHSRGEFSVRAVGEALTPEQLGKIAVRKHPSGAHVYLKDIATIDQGFQRRRFFARFNGNDCKALSIAKTADADSRRVASRVEQTIKAFHAHLPDEITLSTCLDSSDIIRSRMKILLTNLAGGVGLVLFALWSTLGARNALLAIIGIPFSFLCGLMFMHLLGVSINAVSLFALVLCTGMIVDDAIVVLENIYRHVETGRQQHEQTGAPFKVHRAIVAGVDEVMWPVISSSMTTVVAFLPMLIMGGVTGEFFAIIPKTVAVVLLASLVECLMIIPVHYLTFGPRSRVRALWSRAATWEGEAPADAQDRSPQPRRSPFAVLAAYYDRFLAGTLRHRYLAPLPLLGLGFVTYSVTHLLRVDLFPSDYQLIEVDIKTWDDASLQATGRIVAPIEDLINDLRPDYVESVLTSFGISATEDHTIHWRNNIAQLHVQLADTPQVAADPDSVANVIRDKIQAFVDANPDHGIQAFRVWAPQDGPPIGKPVAVRIESPDLSAAKRLAQRYRQRLARIDGVFGISDDLDFGPRQINLRLIEDVASAHGLTQPALSMALRTANDGLVVSSFKDTQSGEDLDVRLMFHERYRRNLADLLDIHIRTPGGYLLRLGDICEIDMSQGYAGIPHFNAKRVVTVTAQVDTDNNTPHNVNALLERQFKPTLAAMPNIRVTYGGEYQETTRSFEALKEAYLMAMVLIYMLLATQFRSYSQPFIIILTVPFACVGVIGGLLLADYPFTIMSFIAIVGLTGVVVNDSIVLLDFVNKQRAKNLSVEQALRTACRLRLRPILLTTITTVLGLLPLAMGWGGKSKIWSPFASSFAWGLAFSTVVTLLIIPALYYIADDLVSLAKRRLRPSGTHMEPVAANPHATADRPATARDDYPT